jgi:hypothetical protein
MSTFGIDYFSTGNPACCQALSPPERFATRVKPCFLSADSALPERSPPSQYTITGFSLRRVEARQRQVLRAEHVAAAELARLAHVEHQRVLAVDEMRRLQRIDPRAAGAPARERPQQHAAGDEGHGDEQLFFPQEVEDADFHSETRHYN